MKPVVMFDAVAQIRDLRGTTIMADENAKVVKKTYLPYG